MKFNIGDKVISKDKIRFGKEVGVVVGIDIREDIKENDVGNYLVKFDSLNIYEGWGYGIFRDNSSYNVVPYKGYAIWTNDIEKVEEDKKEIRESEFEDEEYLRIEFDKVREQKKETIKQMSEKSLELALEIKEIEVEIEKIKKDWHIY